MLESAGHLIFTTVRNDRQAPPQVSPQAPKKAPPRPPYYANTMGQKLFSTLLMGPIVSISVRTSMIIAWERRKKVRPSKKNLRPGLLPFPSFLCMSSF